MALRQLLSVHKVPGSILSTADKEWAVGIVNLSSADIWARHLG